MVFVDDDRRLTYERTQCRSALSDKDVKLAELRQQLISANSQSQQAAAEVRSVAVSHSNGANKVHRVSKKRATF